MAGSIEEAVDIPRYLRMLLQVAKSYEFDLNLKIERPLHFPGAQAEYVRALDDIVKRFRTMARESNVNLRLSKGVWDEGTD